MPPASGPSGVSHTCDQGVGELVGVERDRPPDQLLLDVREQLCPEVGRPRGRRAPARRAPASRTSPPPAARPSGRPPRPETAPRAPDDALSRRVLRSGSSSFGALLGLAADRCRRGSRSRCGTELSAVYDVRRQVVSTDRVNVRTDRRTLVGRRAPPRAAGATGPPPHDRPAEALPDAAGSWRRRPRRAGPGSEAPTPSPAGVRTASAAAPSTGCCAALGAHQATTCDCARVIATYSSRRYSPSSSAIARATLPDHRGPPAADVDAPPARSSPSVEQRHVRLAAGSGPTGGQVDDRVLQALAAVDGDQLHRGGVAVEPAGPLAGHLDLVVGHLLAQPGQQRDQTEPLLRWRPGAGTLRRGAGRSAAARRRPGRGPGRSVRAPRPPRAPRPRPGVANSSAQSRRTSATSSVSASPPASSSAAVCPTNEVSAAARTRADRCGCSSASSSCSHSVAAGVAKTLPLPATTAGTPTSASARCDLLQVACSCTRARRRRAAAAARPLERAPEVSSRLMSRARSAYDVRGRCRHATWRPSPAEHRRGRPRAAGTARRGRRSSRRALVRRVDVAHHDPVVAERGAAQQHLQRVDQRPRRCGSWCPASCGRWRCAAASR